MKDIYEVLRHKETELERLKKEVLALRIVAPLLEDELQVEAQAPPPLVGTDTAMQAKQVAAAPNAKAVWP